MKRILLLLILSSFGAASLAQTLVNGDYRTAKTSGNWSDADMWETRSAGVWAITAIAPSAANNVYVQAGHTVTVDAANVYCKDLQLSTTGSLAIGSNVVNVSGKLRAFNNPAVVGVSDGVYTTNSTSLAAAMIVTSGGGVLKFVGGTRTITATGEWGNATTGNAVEFALNPGAVGTIVTGVKFRPILISSGTVVSDGLCSSGSGDFTIKSGATFKSTRSGGVLWNSSTSKMATLTIETGATLELSGNSPTIDATTIVNNGTVLYSGTSQNLVTKSGTNADGAALFQDYYDLKLSNSGTKQLPSFNVKVANSLTTEGTSSISNTSNSTKIVMANNSSIYRNSTGSIGSTTIEFGASPTDVVNVSVGAAVSAAGELVSSPSPGTIGNLTITPSGVYTITSSRNINDLVNNGLLVLNPTTTMTITVNGDISGAGSITGNESASLNFAGMNPNNAGVLKFTTGSQLLNNLTITRGGVNASVSLGTSLTLNGNLNLTNGSLHIQPGQALTISGVNNISGAPFSSAKYINTQVSGASVGKLIITNLSTSKIIPVGHNGNYLPATLTPTVASDFEVNVFVGATANATPNGTALTAAQKLRMVDAVWNINRISGTGNVDLTLGWENALEGTDFSTFANAQIGIAGYTAGNYGMFTGTGDAGANTATLTTSTFSPFVVGEANTTLPLTLISFTAKESLNSVKLAWQTTDEVNLKNYVLQHRKGNDFEDIYTVAANNKAGIFNYNYTHLNPTAGTNYYRLVGVDFDGSKQTSNPIPVIVTLGNEVTVYPNPVTQKNISVSGAIKGDVIRILNIQGQVVFTKTANGNQVEEIEVQNFQAGTYILSIENAGRITSTKKLIKI